jgi:hypothetical protein
VAFERKLTIPLGIYLVINFTNSIANTIKEVDGNALGAPGLQIDHVGCGCSAITNWKMKLAQGYS